MSATDSQSQTLDYDFYIKQRIENWLKTREDKTNLPLLLLDFYKFLNQCEAERQRA